MEKLFTAVFEVLSYKNIIFHRIFDRGYYIYYGD